MDITSLYAYPLTGNTGHFPYDPALPLKQWSRPLAAGENPNSLVIFTTWDVDVTTAALSFPEFAMSKGEAAAINAPLPGSTSVPNAPVGKPWAHNPPIDMAKLPAGATIVSAGPMAGFGVLPQIHLTGAEPSTPADPTLKIILDDLRMLDVAAGLKPE